MWKVIAALVDEMGMLRAGYAVMAPLAEAGIRGVLGR